MSDERENKQEIIDRYLLEKENLDYQTSDNSVKTIFTLEAILVMLLDIREDLNTLKESIKQPKVT